MGHVVNWFWLRFYEFQMHLKCCRMSIYFDVLVLVCL